MGFPVLTESHPKTLHPLVFFVRRDLRLLHLVVYYEWFFQNTQPSQQGSELFVFGMRKVGVARCSVFESQLVDMGETLVKVLGTIIYAVLVRYNARNFVLERLEGRRYFVDLLRRRGCFVLEDDYVPHFAFFGNRKGC